MTTYSEKIKIFLEGEQIDMKMKKRTYEKIKRNFAYADRCVCCGAIIPEGTQVCRACMIKYGLI